MAPTSSDDPRPDAASVARVLRQYLEESGKSQSEFAAKADVSESSISRLLSSTEPSCRRGTVDSIVDVLPTSYRARLSATPSPRKLGERTRVFVSSTFLDLEDRRRQVIEAIECCDERLKCVTMERSTAAPHSAVSESLERVRSSDLFISILAYRYGWIPDGETKSITELEHDEAQRLGIPRLVFVIDDRKRPMIPDVDADPPELRWELQGKLAAFKARIGSTGVAPRPFGADAELVRLVMQSIIEWLERSGISRGNHHSPAQAPAQVPEARPYDSDLSRYREALLAEHRYISLVGFPTTVRVPIGLNELFVPMRAQLDHADRGKLHPSVEGEQGSEAEADSMRHAGGLDLPLVLERAKSGEAPTGRTAFSAAQDRQRRILVLRGHPGSGKTTQEKRLVNLVLTQDEPAALLGLGFSSTPAASAGALPLLPVYIPLRDLGANDLGSGLAPAIRRCLPEHAHLEESFCSWLSMERRHLLVLLDGLDEVAHELRDDVAGWIARISKADPTSWFVVTSRFVGYGEREKRALDEASMVLDLKPFGESQVEEFVEHWYAIVERASNPAGAAERARGAARDLLDRLNQPHQQAARILEMTANPLLLTIICLVHRDQGRYLPEGRARLYEEAMSILLERWRRAKQLPVSIPADQARRILQPIASFFHEQEGRTSATASELAPFLETPLRNAQWPGTALAFLHAIRDDSGLLCGESQDRYKFLHLGFQEYLAALETHGRFAEYAYEDREKAGEVIRIAADRFGREWWNEYVLFLLGHGAKPNVFAPFFDRVVRLPDDAFAKNHRLVDDCLREAQGLSPRPFVALIDRALGRSKIEADSRWTPSWGAVELAARILVKLDADSLFERAERFAQSASPEVWYFVRGLVMEQRPGLLPKLDRLFDARSGLKAAPRAEVGPSTGVTTAGITLMRVEGGPFAMGSMRGDDDEQPVHEVSVPEFWIARTPVTNAQYRHFVKATGHEPPDSWRDRRFNAPEQPVVEVSWNDAAAFCKWAGLRLPSEAEWEYACRGGKKSEYWFGDKEADLAKYAWYEKNSQGSTRPVAGKPANPFALHDMHGNVWEWCQDCWHESYKGAPTDGRAWESKGAGGRVLRGGSWDDDAAGCRSAFRFSWHPVSRIGLLGFRPASSSLPGFTPSPPPSPAKRA